MATSVQHKRSSSAAIAPLNLVLIPIAALTGFSFLPWVRANPRLAGSFWAAATALLVFFLILRYLASRAGRVLHYDVLPRPVHYVQLAMHTSIYVYWGWYWRQVYHYAPLIVAQIAFVYALDMLVCWSRRDKWIFGFGPFPIVLSTNLFLWFKDDWFFLQFLLVATGVLCKEFLTWDREGRRTHIFNPSAIALALFSLGLLVTQSTAITWGEEVAVTLGRPPNIYLEIFLLGLVVQALFSVTLVTLAAAAALFLLNLAYTGLTGVYYFVDSNIPIAVFLGLHLLVTDPATSPRKNLGKILFGAAYGAGVFAIYNALGWMGAPTFYDKLLCVPPLNLTVQLLDRLSVRVSTFMRRFDLSILRWDGEWKPRRANFAHMAVWMCLFAVMSGTGFIGSRHPGSNPEFWRSACEQGRRNACETWTRTLDLMCQHGAEHACFTLGVARSDGRMLAPDAFDAGKSFARACDLGNAAACLRLIALVGNAGPGIFETSCARGDGESCYIVASLYHAGLGVPKNEERALDLYRQSCETGLWRGCGRLAESYRTGQGTSPDPEHAAEYFERACRGGHAPSCFSAGILYRRQKDEVLAQERFREACELSTRYTETSAAYFSPTSQAQFTGAGTLCSPPNP
jgi:TPR repeat protein